jgi:hypothetical protein
VGYNRPVKRLGVLVLLLLAGCASPIAGKPVAGPRSATPEASADVVKWMNNFCGVANYMIASGGVAFNEVPADPAAAKKSISDSLGRVVDVLNVAIHDLDELTPAPVAAADTAVEVILDPLGRARDEFVSAKSAIDGVTELTTDVFSEVMQNMTEATSVLNEAVEKMSAITLPEEFQQAAKRAENCER